MTVYLSLLVFVVGLLMYTLAKDTQPKTIEVGRILILSGSLAFLLVYTHFWVL